MKMNHRKISFGIRYDLWEVAMVILCTVGIVLLDLWITHDCVYTDNNHKCAIVRILHRAARD